MENLPKDIIGLLALELNYRDVLSLCSTSSKIRKTCDRFWTERSIRDFAVTKDDIIGDPLSYYFGLKENKGFVWYFSDPFFIDFDENGNANITPENINVTFLGSSNDEDEKFYIPGIKFPKNEKVFVAYISLYSKLAEEGTSFAVVSKTKERTFQKMIEKLKYKYWSDIDPDLYLELKNININTGIERTVQIPMGYDDSLYPHRLIFLFFETKI